jgi:hypothetical protein
MATNCNRTLGNQGNFKNLPPLPAPGTSEVASIYCSDRKHQNRLTLRNHALSALAKDIKAQMTVFYTHPNTDFSIRLVG